jgi:hypothetical protein
MVEQGRRALEAGAQPRRRGFGRRAEQGGLAGWAEESRSSAGSAGHSDLVIWAEGSKGGNS